MADCELLAKATASYNKKKYADTVRTVTQLMEKGDYSLPVLLLSAKAWIGLSAADSEDDMTWQNIYSTVNAIMDEVDSYTQYRQIRKEILEAGQDANREFEKLQMKALERKPTLDQFQQLADKGIMFLLFSAKISSTMSQHSKIKKLKDAPKKEEADVLSNKFTDEERYRLRYDSAVKIFDKTKRIVDSGQYFDLRDAALAFMTAKIVWLEATEGLKKESSELCIQRLEKNKQMIQYMLKFNQQYQVVNANGKREWESDHRSITQELDKLKIALQRQKEEAEKARVAAYWKKHPKEKEALNTQLQEQEALLPQLQKELKVITDELTEAKAELDQVLPSEKEYARQRTEVKMLQAQLSDCWFFQVKKKRELREALDNTALPKLAEVKEQAESDRKALKEQVEGRLAQINERLLPKEAALKAAKKAIADIKKQLESPQ